ncbi:CubicO group peptidase (beta-lactamase class C family) [Amorphus suaedae]
MPKPAGFATGTRGTALAAGVAMIIGLAGSSVVRADETVPPDLASIGTITGAHIDAAIDGLDANVAEIMRRSGTPGVAVAVVRDGKTVFAKGYGVRKAGEDARVDADTVFQLASISKSISGSVVAHEVGTGHVTWDTPLVQSLPWFELSDPYVTRHVTVGDMFAHRSGLPGQAGDLLEGLGFDRRQILERLRLMPLASFRDTYAYSNFGLTAGAEAVAAASGKDWADLADEVLFAPLGMASTSARFADFAARGNRAAGHVLVDGVYQPKFVRMPDPQSPAGGVSSSVNDMARWMSMLLQDGAFEGREIVAAEPLRQAMQPQIVSAPAATIAGRPRFYGFGFTQTISSSGRLLIGHSGAFSVGAGTTFSVIPSADVAIVVLTNAAPNGTAEAIVRQFEDVVQTGAVERDWYALFNGAFSQMLAAEGELVGQPRPSDPAASADPAVLAGTYDNAFYGPAEIAAGADGLTLKLGPAGVTFPLAHWDGDTFTFDPFANDGVVGSVSRVVFDVEGGAARAMTIEAFDNEGLGTFERH